MRRRDDLSVPRIGGRSFGIHYDPEAFGRFSEVIARALGTARYLVFQTVVVAVWLLVNTAIPRLRFDPYPYILLTLALSLQASYAAPLILLAQNRQADRDRVEVERDRETGARTQADAEFIARELASVRLALSDVVTTDDLRDALADLRQAMARLEEGLSPRPPAAPG
ncbi:MAG TPA: DUF1003 domain-containing protein [Acidimicrobiales bacterium]|jgi:uncharacterized membrane protein